MLHVIKIKEQYADAIADGRKNFEVRLNDRGYNAGDQVTFVVQDSFGIDVLHHPLEGKKFEITYVHSGLGLESNYVVFGIAESAEEKPIEEIVHCGECKHIDIKSLFCTLHSCHPTESDYCSWGERE